MIELKVEEYCHNCPDFEAVQHTEFYNHKLVCMHARKCAAIKQHLENTQPKLGFPIKTADLCAGCYYGFANRGCSRLGASLDDIDIACDGCPNHIGGIHNCACAAIDIGDPCPYYKHYKEAKND